MWCVTMGKAKIVLASCVLTLVIASHGVAQEKVEPLVDIRKERLASATPAPSQVEKAYSTCLKGVDAEFAAVRTGGSTYKEARRAEEELCHRARRECITAPSGADCKGFVVDYAE